jgi:hypothetical protein
MAEDFRQWPQQGCALGAARNRIACLSDAVPAGDLPTNSSQFATETMRALAEGQWVGYRISRDGDANRIIDRRFWLSEPVVDWERSPADGIGAHDDAILVFPALLAPDRARLIAQRSYKEIFDRYVLNDPEVAAWGRKAIARASEFERVFTHGHCYLHGVHEWPVAFERGLVGIVHPDPDKRGPYGALRRPDSIEAAIAAEVLTNRYGALITMLRLGEVEGRAILSASGAPDTVLRSIWSHRDYYLSAEGDIFAINEEREAPAGPFLVRQWLGLVFELPSGFQGPFQEGLRISDPPSVGVNLQARKERALVAAADVIAARTLSAALDRLVFAHPEILALRGKAIEASERCKVPYYEFANLIAPVAGMEEPVLPLRYFNDRTDDFGLPEPQAPDDVVPDPEWDELFSSQPGEITACYEAINKRASEFFALLQDGLILARGHVADGHLVDIAQSIWSHEDYYIHCPTGDLYEAGRERLEKRFTAVILVAPVVRQTAVDVSREHSKVLLSTTSYGGDAPALSDDQASLQYAPMPTKSAMRGKARLESYRLCVDWLAGEMRRSPDVRQRPKAFWRAQAKKKWHIADRAFTYAWDEAIRETNAIAWSKAGPPKRAHRNPCTD